MKMVFNLPDDEAARVKAQEIADRAGIIIIVTDEVGLEVCRVAPIGYAPSASVRPS